MAINTLKMDPSRTTFLRSQFIAAFKRRFATLARDVEQFVGKEDCFALDHSEPQRSLLTNERAKFIFETDSGKLERFQDWFKERVNAKVLEVDPKHKKEPWTSEFVNGAYRKGIVRGFEQVNKEYVEEKLDFYAGKRAEFLRSAFAAPETTSKVQLVGTRAFEKLKGITAEMGAEMNRIIAEGIAGGKGAGVLARELVASIKSIDKARAARIARTEVIYAHAEGQLDSFEKLGVEEVGIMAEWATAGDSRVCPYCNEKNKSVLTVAEAHGLIPLHPNCRCAWRPRIKKRVGKIKPPPKLPPKLPDVEEVITPPIVEKIVPPVTPPKPRIVEKDAGNPKTLGKEITATKVQGISYSKETVDPNKPLEVWGENIRQKLATKAVDSEARAIEIGREVNAKFQSELKSIKDTIEKEYYAPARRAYNEAQELKAAWRNVYTLFPSPEQDKVINAARAAYDAKIIEHDLLGAAATAAAKESRLKAYRATLSAIRDVGPDVEYEFAKGSTKEVEGILNKAMGNFPKDWNKKSAVLGKQMKCHYANEPGMHYAADDRAYYDARYLRPAVPSEICVPFNGGAEYRKSVAAHEFFHRCEETNSRIVKLEREFFQRRTKGDTLQDLGGNMAGEKYLPDKWKERYMGKSYAVGSRYEAYEVGTMAMEALLHESNDTFKDVEVMEWLWGLLAGV